MPVDAKKPRMELGSLTHHNIKQLRLLNQVIFPVTYSDKFYTEALKSGEYAKLAYFEDVIVGSVCCRIDTNAETGEKSLYIMTLGVLASYRRRGLGAIMLKHVIEQASKDSSLAYLCLHVQTSNTDAVEFYKMYGFDIVETLPEYYKRIEPTSAYKLQLKNRYSA